MSKFLCAIGIVCLSVLSVSAQTDDRSGSTNSKTALQAKLKAGNMVANDQSEVLNITGVNSFVFTVSNLADGTEKSFHHNQRIVVSLNISESKSEKYQLVFYSNDDRLPFAVASDLSSFSIYYPIHLYESIKTKLEQAIAAKKKVQLKIVRKMDGYREGSLIF